MKISWKTAAAAFSSLAILVSLTGCAQHVFQDNEETTPNLLGNGVPDPQVWVSDNKISTFTAPSSGSGQATSASVNLSPGASTMTYWTEGIDLTNVAEQPKTACTPANDDCGKLFYSSQGQLFAIDAPAAGTTPVPRRIQVQTSPVTGPYWGGQGGSVLYVLYPFSAAVGVIDGISETENIPALIKLPGTSPQYFAPGYPGGSVHYIISGSPGSAQFLEAFNDSGPITGLPKPSVTTATSIAANQNYVAVIASGALQVYDAQLNFIGTVAGGGNPLPNPYSVVIDENSNYAYVTSLSSPTVAGQVNVVYLGLVSGTSGSTPVIGPAVTVGKGPLNTELSWDGTLLFVANENDGPPGTISVLSTTNSDGSASLLQTVTVGTKPTVLAVHP